LKFIKTITLCLLYLSNTGLFSETSELDTFLKQVFPTQIPTVKALWISGEFKKELESAMGKEPARMREKYWRQGEDFVFVLEQIGKVKPITTAWHVRKGIIVKAEVLVYRETRGSEVTRPFFTKLFEGVGLIQDKKLNTEIDGISGATLSVWAMKHMAQQALMMAQYLKNHPN